MAGREHCAQCGFDSELYDQADTISSQRIVSAVLEAAVEDLDDETLGRRPAVDTWSIVEYIDHVREVVFGNRLAIEVAVADPGTDLGAAPDIVMTDDAVAIDLAVALAAVTDEYEAMRSLLASLDDEQWHQTVTIDGEAHPVAWFARHVLHDGLHHMADIGRIRAGFGFGANEETGHVVQLSVSGGGVPKASVASIEVSAAGVAGDVQNDRRHHGRPVQAVCVWSADVIAELAAQGHPIAPGSAGENITVAGVNWAQLRPGARVTVGEVPLLISAHAIPCAKNAQWFSDRDFNRILHQRHPGMSRLYAIPLAAGTISPGDPVTVEPS